jgi:Tol biopolymer transport system component
MIDPDGSGETHLTTGALEDSHPSWSPDSEQIIFQSCRSDRSFDIYTIDIATKSLTRITSTDKMDEHQPIWIK